MYTRCPACQTLFRVRPETLRVAHGQVRCGRCDTQFNALETLTDEPEELVAAVPPEGGQPPAVSDFINMRQAVDESVGNALDSATPGAVSDRAVEGMAEADLASGTGCVAAAVEAVERQPETSTPDSEQDADIAPDEHRADSAAGTQPRAPEPLPSLSPAVRQELLLHDEHAASGRGRRWAWGGAAGVLLLVLCGQWMYLQRAHLYEYPSLRPYLRNLCSELGCELPLERAPERIEVIERLVRAHPRVADALLVEVTFVSRADGSIMYPILELQLTDVSGNRMAARRFAPAEYLPAGVDPGPGLAPERPVQVSLELVAPRTEVVSFQFDFL